MIWRTLVLLHRYLGVGIGVVMLMWFATGIVMLFVPYPDLPEKDRLALLPPIPWHDCCRVPATSAPADQPIERAEVESVAGVLALRYSLPGRLGILASIDRFEPELPLGLAQARFIASEAAHRLRVSPAEPTGEVTIVRDQWTVSGEYNADRPLTLFRFIEPQHTEIYVSAHRGRVVLRTTGSQRFWNWLGAVPHWLYPTALRSHPRVWTQVVIWSSVVGAFLAILGLYLGIVQYMRRGKHLLSPYAGVWNWHHSLGLFFGILTLTWVVSGLISMNPLGFLEGGPGVQPSPDARSVTWGDIQTSLTRIASKPAVPRIVSLVMAPLAGDLYWIATQEGGAKFRLNAAGLISSLSADDLLKAAQHAAGPSGIASATLLQHEDAYYYARHGAVPLPVFRVIANDQQHTRLYLDPQSGRLLTQIDSDGRWQRWLFDGLHRLDFSPALRASLTWSVLVVLLLLGGVALSGTGTYMAARRVILDIRRLRR